MGSKVRVLKKAKTDPTENISCCSIFRIFSFMNRYGGYAASAHSFCDVNLVDHGYTVNHRYNNHGYHGSSHGYYGGNYGHRHTRQRGNSYGFGNNYAYQGYGHHNNGYGHHGNNYRHHGDSYRYGHNYRGYGHGNWFQYVIRDWLPPTTYLAKNFWQAFPID